MTVNDPAPATAREGQLRSEFTIILETLCDSCVGAIGAGLVDEEGECVDLAFTPSRDIPAYSIKLCGAHWQIVMREIAASAKLVRTLGLVHQLWVETEQFGYVIENLHHGYVLVLICRPDALRTVSPRALRQAEVELYAEAGWQLSDPQQPYWRRSHVLLGPDSAPTALRYAQGFMAPSGRGWDEHLHALYKLEGLADFERGWAVQTDRGETIHMVREPSGYWYCGFRL